MGKLETKAMSYERTGSQWRTKVVRDKQLQKIMNTHDYRRMTTLQLMGIIYRRWEIEILTVVAISSLVWAIISNIK